MILAPADCDQMLARGWGELHPWARLGKIQATTTMVCAPRDDAELETVLAIAAAALRHAKGAGTA
jgi:hypothetical protein